MDKKKYWQEQNFPEEVESPCRAMSPRKRRWACLHVRLGFLLRIAAGGTWEAGRNDDTNFTCHYRSVKRQVKTHDMACLFLSYMVMDGLSFSYRSLQQSPWYSSRSFDRRWMAWLLVHTTPAECLTSRRFCQQSSYCPFSR
jgi:hypothetical protein